ncbi:MAG: tyrosine-type recombinase/integrase, partial [Thiobacillus sp.]
HSYYQAWRRILDRAGVPKVGTHGIRHRSATDIANSGVPLKVGMALTAHKTVAMFMRYVHTEDNPVRQAAELVATPGARPSRRRGSASPRRPRHERPDAQSSKRCRPCLPATPASTTA